MTLPRVTDSGSLAQQVAAGLAKSAGQSARLRAGKVITVDATGNVTVNVDGVNLTALSLPGVPLQPGDLVKVLQQGGTFQVICLVFTHTLPVSGTVASVPAGASTITVTTSIGSVACQWLASYTPTVGDTVMIAWLGSTPLALGKLGATPAPAPPPPPPSQPAPPPSTSSTGTTSFAAVSSGTYRSGWLDNSITNGNVMQGDYGYGPNDGAWFTGGKPHSTLAGATVTDCKIWLKRDYGGSYAAQTVHLERVANNTRPSGALSFDSAHATDSIALAVGQYGWFDVPNSIAQALVDSGGSLGVTSADPYVRLFGTQNDSRAGLLRISWRRTS